MRPISHQKPKSQSIIITPFELNDKSTFDQELLDQEKSLDSLVSLNASHIFPKWFTQKIKLIMFLLFSKFIEKMRIIAQFRSSVHKSVSKFQNNNKQKIAVFGIFVNIWSVFALKSGTFLFWFTSFAFYLVFFGWLMQVRIKNLSNSSWNQR